MDYTVSNISQSWRRCGNGERDVEVTMRITHELNWNKDFSYTDLRPFKVNQEPCKAAAVAARSDNNRCYYYAQGIFHFRNTRKTEGSPNKISMSNNNAY